MQISIARKLFVLFLLCQITNGALFKNKAVPNEISGKATATIPSCPAYATPGIQKGGVMDTKNTKTYETSKDNLVVYRLFTQPAKSNKAVKIGTWWTFVKPSGKKADYMAKNAICSEFNDMTHMVTCTLNKNQSFCIGPTQSMRCENGDVLPPNFNYQTLIAGAYKKTDNEVIGPGKIFSSCTVTASPLI